MDTPLRLWDALREKPWYCSPHLNYGILGWFETVIKLIGIGVACFSWIAFIYDSANGVGPVQQLEPGRIAEIVIFFILLALYLAAIIMRIIAAELFGLFLQLLLLIGHVVLTFGLFLQYDPSDFIFLYGMLMCLGEMVHMIFLFLRSDRNLLQIYNTPVNFIWGMSAVSILLYIALLICQVVVYTTTYQQFHGF